MYTYEFDNQEYSSLTESFQNNPLRWCVVKKKEDKILSQTPIFKCKDYFNDFVAKKNGIKFIKYGMDNSKIVFNKDGGLHVLVMKVIPEFLTNLKCLEEKCLEDLGNTLTVVYQDDMGVVLNFPKEFWKSTYTVSLVSLLIRCCNYQYFPENWEGFFKKGSPIGIKQENVLTLNTLTWVKNLGLKAPVSNWYSIPGVENLEETLSYEKENYIHNNGCNNWYAASLMT